MRFQAEKFNAVDVKLSAVLKTARSGKGTRFIGGNRRDWFPNRAGEKLPKAKRRFKVLLSGFLGEKIASGHTED